MISRVEALRYRCLRYVEQRVEPFQILVGANASGKSTFLDVPVLIGDLLRKGVGEAVQVSRAGDVRDLVWMHGDESFEVAVELAIPEDRRARLPIGHDTARYELSVGHDDKGELCVLQECLWLKPSVPGEPRSAYRQLELFPDPPDAPRSILLVERKNAPKGHKKIVSNSRHAANAYFHAETTDWQNPFRLKHQKPALANLPDDEDRFPVAVWVKQVLMEGANRLVLSGEAMRWPAPPGSPRELRPDGSNLPWAIEALRAERPEDFDHWIRHVRAALPDVQTVATVERAEDRHRYLLVRYATGLEAPSWTVSDGTLRFLALTLLAYIDPPGKVFFVEEPENGIHPQAVEAVFQALSSVRQSQVLCASHSPIILSLAEPPQLLCFARTPEGVTHIVSGADHPNLRDWRRGADLGLLFASGVLG